MTAYSDPERRELLRRALKHARDLEDALERLEDSGISLLCCLGQARALAFELYAKLILAEEKPHG